MIQLKDMPNGGIQRRKRFLVVNNAEPGVTEFTGPICDIIIRAGGEAETIDYAKCTGTLTDLFDGVILSGSPQGNDIVDHHLPYFQWILKYAKPLFGICAGHHITGVLYGSELFRSKEAESGISKIFVIEDDPLFRGITGGMEVMQMHNDSISVPPGFILLATSPTCSNQAMKHKDKPLYTCQFHPEYLNHELFFNFFTIC